MEEFNGPKTKRMLVSIELVDDEMIMYELFICCVCNNRIECYIVTRTRNDDQSNHIHGE